MSVFGEVILEGEGEDEGMGEFGAPLANVARLQRAIAALGLRVRDATVLGTSRGRKITMATISVDGVTGPITAAGVNRALTNYISAGNSPPELRTGRLTPLGVQGQAAKLADIIEKEVARRGGIVPRATAPTVPVRVPGARAPAPRAPAPTKSASVGTLQGRLRQLGTVARDSALIVVADGVVGPKTTLATNRAFQRHVVGAPPSYRTGRLTANEIRAAAPTLAVLLGKELARRRVVPLAPPLPGPGIVPDMPPAADQFPASSIPPTPEAAAQSPELAPTVPPIVAPSVSPPSPTFDPDAPLPPSEALMPAPEKKPFPTAWVVGGGVALVAAVGITLALTRKRSGRYSSRYASI